MHSNEKLPFFFLLVFTLLIVAFFSSLFVQPLSTSLSGAYIFQGKSTFGTTGVSILVDGTGPNITIIRPLNKTFLKPTRPLNITVNDTSGISHVYYALDNSINTTLVLNPQGFNHTLFNASEGSHTIYVFANDSLGNFASANVTFRINESSPPTLNWTEFQNNVSTNLSQFSYLQLQNISNLTLHHPDHCTIRFNSIVDLTQDVPDDTNAGFLINLDNHIVHDVDNYVFINDSEMPGLNESANITFFNVTFTNPRILLNGETCSSSECQEINYSGTHYTFSVSHFSSYEVVEGEAESGSSSGSSGGSTGGGGGSAGTSSLTNLGLLEELKLLSLKPYSRVFFILSLQGKSQQHSLYIKNINHAQKTSTLRVNSETFTLKINETHTFDFTGDQVADFQMMVTAIKQNTLTLALLPLHTLSSPILDSSQGPGVEEPSSDLEDMASSPIYPQSEHLRGIYVMVFLFVGMILILLWFGFVVHRKEKRR